MKKIKSLGFVLFCALGVPVLAEQKTFENKTGEVKVADLGEWKVVKGSDTVKDGQAVFKLNVPEDNMHFQCKFFEIDPPFDVMTPHFGNQIKSSLSQGGMQVVASGQADFLGEKALRVYAIKVNVEDGVHQVIHVVSISAFFGNKFLTMSISDDNPDLSANKHVQHLIKNLKVLPN